MLLLRRIISLTPPLLLNLLHRPIRAMEEDRYRFHRAYIIIYRINKRQRWVLESLILRRLREDMRRRRMR